MNLGSMEQRTEGMKKQAQELIEQAYNRGYKAGQENALTVDSEKFIEQGRNEAWEAMKKLYLPVDEGGLPGGEISKIFDELSWFRIVKIFSASEVVEKLRAYEAQKKQEEDSEIHVGDEVYISDTGCHGVVTYIYEVVNGKKNAVCITQDGTWNVNEIRDLHKTGHHFPEITEVLKKMKGE